jgi:spore photoproduct lyase
MVPGRKVTQPELFQENRVILKPTPPSHFRPERIVLSKGSISSPEKRALVESICSAYPDAIVEEQLDIPHNRINLDEADSFRLHYRGKRTLVLGEHKSAVRCSSEDGNTCPNYRHFSPYGFCPYDCKYCYLAGTPGVWFSPAVKVFVNLPEILSQIDQTACKLGEQTAFYLGKLQDGLALDSLTGYSRLMVPFFAAHSYARLIVLTKSCEVKNLLDLEHKGRTILSWSLNPPEICRRFEANTPPPEKRIEAMKACATAGYPVRAVIMPIIPIANWRPVYERFLVRLLEEVKLDRITLGGICIYSSARRLMERKLGAKNTISEFLVDNKIKPADGRTHFSKRQRIEIYGHMIKAIRGCNPELPVALCLEENPVFEALNLTDSIGKCNCVL